MGSDPEAPGSTRLVQGFNPRSRMGSDAPAARECHLPAMVSIHAPVWGATLDAYGLNGQQLFQSTLPYGERLQ